MMSNYIDDQFVRHFVYWASWRLQFVCDRRERIYPQEVANYDNGLTVTCMRCVGMYEAVTRELRASSEG